MYKIANKTSVAFFVFGIFFLIASCVNDNLPLEENDLTEGTFGDDVYSLNLMVTLDNLGTRSSITANEPAEITKYENYINLERFRVLFFDVNDMFLFESKNRWVKQIDANDNFSSWFVSVPFGAFGNDSYGEGKEYDWEAIRNHLTTKQFKIAILANRPAQLLYPGFLDSELELPNGVFDNDGPYWGPEDTGKRSIFDLHHYQYDIIYADKGSHNGGATKSYYDFVMGDINTDKPTMGAAINWVSFDNGDTDKELLTGSNYMRNIKMPSEEHPIPMYGIQLFEPIPSASWKKGTPFNLSNLPVFPDGQEYKTKSISLLRSCVRLDLRIPKTIKNGAKPTFVTLWYSNIYSRCEPMDTWTPTDEIWKDNHETECEWKSILNYGPVSSNQAPGNGTTKDDYQKRLSWFYGVWKDKGWEFKTRSGNKVTPVGATTDTPYPHIFNPCIQRNKVIQCNYGDVSKYYNDNYNHWIVYTGERNCNDPNTLPDMTKNPYIACWIISWDKKNYYCIPLLNYEKNSDPDLAGVFGPHSTTNTKNDPYQTGSWPELMNTYINSLPSERGDNLPYPLLRNHIYRFTLTGKTRAQGDSDDIENIAISSEVLQTSDINFSEKVQQLDLSRISHTPTVKTKPDKAK